MAEYAVSRRSLLLQLKITVMLVKSKMKLVKWSQYIEESSQ